MIDSLTVSVLLFVALAIGAVVVWDAWRAWRLRRLSVERRADPAAPQPEEGPGVPPPAPASAPGLGRAEPSLGFDSQAIDTRAEPALSITPDGISRHVPAPAPREQTALWEASSVGQDRREGTREVFGTQGLVSPLEPAERTNEVPDSQPAGEVPNPAHFAANPALGAPVSSTPLSAQQAPGRVEPADDAPLAAVAEIAEQHPAAPARPAPMVGAVISERTDCIALLRFLQPVACDRVMALAQSLRRAGSKPVLTEIADQSAGGTLASWQPMKSGQWCTAVRFGLLLANRAGPLNALEYTDFAQRVRDIASTLGVGVDVPDMSAALARARELDAQSAQLDATICVNVDAGEVLGPSQLASLAAPLAITERGNNRYARLGSRGESIFSVALGERSNRLSFLLDLPRVDPQAQAFSAMLESARVAARRLPGRLVDDEGRSLNDRSLEQIARGIEQRQQALAAAGLAAGSAPALRVFN